MAALDFAARGWRRGFYLPTTSDSGIVVLRQWLEGVAGERAGVVGSGRCVLRRSKQNAGSGVAGSHKA